MKRRFSTIGLLVTALTALALTSPAQAKEQVPFKGHGTGVARVLGVDEDGLLAINISGEGVVTQLGHYTTGGGDTPNTRQDLDTGEWWGTYTFVAANGDEVRTTAYGLESSEGDFTITGGTGRFEKASGSFHMWFFAEPPDADGSIPFTIVWNGSISRPGANK